MLRGLWRLTWLEVKIFVREPLGVFGTVLPALAFIAFGRAFGRQMQGASPEIPRFMSADLPVFASMLIALSAVSSLVAIIAIYREGGILRRLRATPLRPYTILTAHVLVKLVLTGIALTVMVLAGRRYYPIDAAGPMGSFTLAVLFTTVCILSMGFLIASLVPTARFAQPVGSLILYPMLLISGLFMPVESLPPMLQALARVLPLTYAVSLLRGIWHGAGWSTHVGDVTVLTLMFLAFTVLSAKVFRWQ